MTPEPEHVYLVQVLASVEVDAPDKRAAVDLALAELAHRCETRHELFIRTEELK